jgi:predicted naringenin-chalcone synthase
MQVYEQASVEVGTQAAQRALDDYSAACGCTPEEAAGEITHLLAVSCTGFFAPGLDQMIVRGLNLSPTVERTLIGFMGCAAAFNALRLATQIVQAQPSARVLVVCVELCSIHIQPSLERVDLVGGAVFCDGAAACVVGMPQPTQRDVFEIAAFHTELTPETESFMVWKIGDHGYTLHLSAEVPSNLARVGPLALQKLLGASAPTMDFWAIHPGGRAILDGLETIFELTPHDMEPSRAVLRDYGNMSSPTILFVLQAHRERLRRNTANELTHGVMMAFGPGLVTEMAHLLYAPPCVEVSAAGAA